MSMTTRHIVAIPARDEAAHVVDCLRALAGQAQQVLLLVNNSQDGTEHVAAREAAALRLDLTVSVHHLPESQASAGHARKLAMDEAAALAPGAVLLTTDADSRVAPGWIAANLRHLARGADAVAGRALIDPVDAAAIPARLHEDDARECRLAALLDEIASILDPDTLDPWPRHTEHSGASICATAQAFHQVGGMPDLPLGEDRGFFQALRRIDARVRHAPDVTVTVSGRIVGRARGGMADTIRRRLAAPDPLLDDAIEPVAVAARRARLRARARAAWRHPDRSSASLAARLALPVPELRQLLARPFFGTAWDALERRSPTLRRARVPAAQVGAETALAERVLAFLRLNQVRRTDPSDTSRLVDAPLA